jgi:photosystem II stability/assembly factor-like uncharacterized protein
MKLKSLLFLLLFPLFSFSQWNSLIPSITHYRLADVSFVNPSEGWVVGNGRTIMHTNDTANSFTIQNSGFSDGEILGVHAFNSNDAYAVISEVEVSTGSNQSKYEKHLLKTSNGGLTWQSNLINDNYYRTFNAIDFYDLDSGYVVGFDGQIFRTKDGGSVWDSLSFPTTGNPFMNDLMDVLVTGSNEVLVVTHGGAIYRSIDAGQNWNVVWQPININGTPVLRKLTPFTSDTIFACGPFKVLRSDNRGQSWKLLNDTVNNSLPSSADFTDIHFADTLHGYATAGNYFFLDRGEVFKTTDGGKTWSSLINNNVYFGNKNLDRVHYVNGEITVFGNLGRIAKSYDDGLTWSYPFEPDEGPISNPSDIEIFSDSTYLLSCLGLKNLWKSYDSGSNWIRLDSAGVDYTNFLASSNNGVTVSCDGNKIVRSLDQGENWVISDTLHSSMLWGEFIDDKTFIGYTYYDSLLISYDTAKSFSFITRPSNGGIRQVKLLNDSSWLLLQNKNLYRTDDAGNSRIFLNSNSPRRFTFKDSLNGFAVNGAIQLGIFKTQDGGRSWQVENNSFQNDNFLDIQSQSNIIVALGVNKTIVSTDYGITWQVFNDLNNYNINPNKCNIQINDLGTWILNGELGEILENKSFKTSNTVNLFESSTNISKDVSIYPNPVSSRIYIKTNNSERISNISVYDINFQKIRILNKGASESNSSINVSNYNKGVYILEIELSEKKIQRKFIKL